MALPVLDKTWQFNVNQKIPAISTLANGRAVMLAIKNSLIGFASSPWTVRGSSNSVAAAMDSSDRWVAGTDLVWANAGTAHSWIVLRQAGVNTSGTFEFCIDLTPAATNGNAAIFVISPAAGFTGGTTLNRPTATDEMVMPSGGTNTWGMGTSGAYNYVLHAMQSNDGQVTYVIMHYSNTPVMFWMFARAKNPVSGWTHPFVAFTESEVPNTGNNVSTSHDVLDLSLFDPTAVLGRSYGASPMGMVLTSEGTSAVLLSESSLFTGPNDFNGEYPILPIGVMSQTPNHRGRHGQLFDLWLGLDTLADGDTYPADTTRQLVQFGTYVFPWNGTVPVTT